MTSQLTCRIHPLSALRHIPVLDTVHQRLSGVQRSGREMAAGGREMFNGYRPRYGQYRCGVF